MLIAADRPYLDMTSKLMASKYSKSRIEFIVSDPPEIALPPDNDLEFVAAGGHMGALIRKHNWQSTPFGDVRAWPQSLKSALSICLNTPIVSAVHWGTELRTLYNDAYIPALAERHPWALGEPFSAVWAEIWDVLSPQIDLIFGTGRGFSTEQQLLRMKRNGILENTWWIYSFAPITDEGGKIAGIFVTALDTTAQVAADEKRRQSEERLQLALSAGNSIGTWDWNVVTDEVKADQRFARLYGVDVDRASTGAPIAEFFHNVHPADVAKLSVAIDAATRTGAPFCEEYRLVQSDGSVQWVTAQGRCIMSPEGTPLRFPGVTFDITERKNAEEHRKIMVDELNHRVKNTLAVVQSIAVQTFNGKARIDVAREAFQARLINLAKAHDVLSRENWSGADIREIVADAIGLHSVGSRFNCAGPSLKLRPSAALAIQMALHELSTNAAKYGALSNSDGSVDIVWTIDDMDGLQCLKLVWSEIGGPEVYPPNHMGFGSRLIERALAQQLGGTVSLTYSASGLVCRIEAPTSAVNLA